MQKENLSRLKGEDFDPNCELCWLDSAIWILSQCCLDSGSLIICLKRFEGLSQDFLRTDGENIWCKSLFWISEEWSQHLTVGCKLNHKEKRVSQAVLASLSGQWYIRAWNIGQWYIRAWGLTRGCSSAQDPERGRKGQNWQFWAARAEGQRLL